MQSVILILESFLCIHNIVYLGEVQAELRPATHYRLTMPISKHCIVLNLKCYCCSL